MAKIIDLVTNAGQVDVTKGIVEEAVKSCPEMQFFDADTVPGTTIATLARTSLPTVAFRNLGDPVRSSRSGYAEVYWRGDQRSRSEEERPPDEGGDAD